MTDPVTAHPIDTEALRRLADAATEGPWIAKTCEPCAEHGRVDVQIWDEHGHILIAQWMDEFDPDAGDDAAFIAAARTAVPALLDALAQAERDRDRLFRSSRLAKEGRIKANARADQAEHRATRAESERDEWRQTALDERGAALDALEQIKAREARAAEEKHLRMKATAAATRAEERIKAVQDVHTGTVWPGVADKPICDACDQPWPCPTIRALD